MIFIPHLHICASDEVNSKVNDEHTNHIIASWFVALALEAVFQHESKTMNGENGLFALMCTNMWMFHACENSSFAPRHRHTNVCASGKVKHEYECVNAVLHLCLIVNIGQTCVKIFCDRSVIITRICFTQAMLADRSQLSCIRRSRNSHQVTKGIGLTNKVPFLHAHTSY